MIERFRSVRSLLMVGGFAAFMVAWLVYSELLAPGWIEGRPGHPLVRWYTANWAFDGTDVDAARMRQWYVIARLFTAFFLTLGLGLLVLLHKPARPSPRGTAAGKWALLGLLAGLALIGPRADLWPLLTAAVYTDVYPTPHPTINHEWDLHVVSADGSRVVLEPHEFWGQGRAFEVRSLLQRAAALEADGGRERDEYRRYLWHMARDALDGEEPAGVEVWLTTWDVEPMALPAAAHDGPVSVEPLATIGRPA